LNADPKKSKLIDTREKDRQSQMLCAFALLNIMMDGWRTVPEIRFSMGNAGFPRCERTIRRLFRALKAAGVEIVADRKRTPHRFKVLKTRPFSRRFRF